MTNEIPPLVGARQCTCWVINQERIVNDHVVAPRASPPVIALPSSDIQDLMTERKVPLLPVAMPPPGYSILPVAVAGASPQAPSFPHPLIART
jgi:hypothetical protein